MNLEAQAWQQTKDNLNRLGFAYVPKFCRWPVFQGATEPLHLCPSCVKLGGKVQPHTTHMGVSHQ